MCVFIYLFIKRPSAFQENQRWAGRQKKGKNRNGPHLSLSFGSWILEQGPANTQSNLSSAKTETRPKKRASSRTSGHTKIALGVDEEVAGAEPDHVRAADVRIFPLHLLVLLFLFLRQVAGCKIDMGAMRVREETRGRRSGERKTGGTCAHELVEESSLRVHRVEPSRNPNLRPFPRFTRLGLGFGIL
jgi:hypothetical protein